MAPRPGPRSNLPSLSIDDAQISRSNQTARNFLGNRSYSWLRDPNASTTGTGPPAPQPRQPAPATTLCEAESPRSRPKLPRKRKLAGSPTTMGVDPPPSAHAYRQLEPCATNTVPTLAKTGAASGEARPPGPVTQEVPHASQTSQTSQISILPSPSPSDESRSPSTAHAILGPNLEHQDQPPVATSPPPATTPPQDGAGSHEQNTEPQQDNAPISAGPSSTDTPALDNDTSSPPLVDTALRGPALCRRWLACLDDFLAQCGGFDSLDSSVEKPRVDMLRRALLRHDVFYVFLHQLLVQWSNPPTRDLPAKLLELPPAIMDHAARLLNGFLRPPEQISERVRGYLINFPLDLSKLPNRWGPTFPQDLQRVAQFLVRLSSEWRRLEGEIRQRGIPLRASELYGVLMLPSISLQQVLFTVSRRMLSFTDIPQNTATIRQIDSVAIEDRELYLHRESRPSQVQTDFEARLVAKYRDLVAQGRAATREAQLANGVSIQQQQQNATQYRQRPESQEEWAQHHQAQANMSNAMFAQQPPAPPPNQQLRLDTSLREQAPSIPQQAPYVEAPTVTAQAVSDSVLPSPTVSASVIPTRNTPASPAIINSNVVPRGQRRPSSANTASPAQSPHLSYPQNAQCHPQPWPSQHIGMRSQQQLQQLEHLNLLGQVLPQAQRPQQPQQPQQPRQPQLQLHVPGVGGTVSPMQSPGQLYPPSMHQQRPLLPQPQGSRKLGQQSPGLGTAGPSAQQPYRQAVHRQPMPQQVQQSQDPHQQVLSFGYTVQSPLRQHTQFPSQQQMHQQQLQQSQQRSFQQHPQQVQQGFAPPSRQVPSQAGLLQLLMPDNTPYPSPPVPTLPNAAIDARQVAQVPASGQALSLLRQPRPTQPPAAAQLPQWYQLHQLSQQQGLIRQNSMRHQQQQPLQVQQQPIQQQSDSGHGGNHTSSVAFRNTRVFPNASFRPESGRIPWTEAATARACFHMLGCLSPPRRLTAIGGQPAQSEPHERYYQYVDDLPAGQVVLRTDCSLVRLEFQVSAELFQKLAKVTVPPDHDIKVADYYESCRRLRLRICEMPGSRFKEVEAAAMPMFEWAVAKLVWPEVMTVKLNENTYLEIPRSPSFRTPKPCELTSHIKVGANVLSIGVLTKPKAGQCYLAAVESVITLAHSTVLRRVCEENTLPEQHTLDIVRTRLMPAVASEDEDEEEGDIPIPVDQEMCISLADPFSTTLVNIPCRGVNCRHLDVFDLETWLESRPVKLACLHGQHHAKDSRTCPTCKARGEAWQEPSLVDAWQCPICSEDASPRSLRVDAFLRRVRNELVARNLGGKTKSVLVDGDGNWKPKLEDVSDSKGGGDDEDDDSDEEPRPPKRRRTTASKDQGGSRPTSVITIDD